MRSDFKSATRGGSSKSSKMLQEGGHFLIRGGSDKPKTLQEGGHFLIRGGSDKSNILQEGVSSNTDMQV